MSGRAARCSGGLPDSDMNDPFDEEAYRRQWALLKSLHCARPVLYRGKKEFISCLTITGTGTQIDMIVYLAGFRNSVDSAEVQIMQTVAEGIGA